MRRRAHKFILHMRKPRPRLNVNTVLDQTVLGALAMRTLRGQGEWALRSGFGVEKGLGRGCSPTPAHLWDPGGV